MHAANLHDLFKPLEGTPTTPNATLASRRIRLSAPPKEPVTRLYLNNKPVSTPGNITTLISKAKTGKTAALGAATAAIIAAHYDLHDADTFKFTAPHTDEAVIVFDTEQSPFDAWTCHQRTLKRAGTDQDPEWLHHYSLAGLNAKALRALLPQAIAAADRNIFTLILDGVADFVTSVNDEVECNDFVAYLQGLAITHNCAIICVIHSNEGVKSGDDGRGHLGKQLTRKAESNLLLRKEGEITTITSEKQRKAPITEKDGVAFKWDEDAQRHVTVETAPKSPAGRKGNYHFEEFAPIFTKGIATAQGFRPLHRKAKEIRPSIGVSTLEGVIAEGVNMGLVAIDRTNPLQPKYYAV